MQNSSEFRIFSRISGRHRGRNLQIRRVRTWTVRVTQGVRPRVFQQALASDAYGLTPYYRGLAYLELKSGKEAASQFQKILDNHGLVTTHVNWPLAHLGLARAYAMQGDTAKAEAAYQDFLTLWKDADPNIPILKQAKAEYAKLK